MAHAKPKSTNVHLVTLAKPDEKSGTTKVWCGSLGDAQRECFNWNGHDPKIELVAVPLECRSRLLTFLNLHANK